LGRSRWRDQDARQIGPLHSLIPSWEGQAAHPEEKRGPARNIKLTSGVTAQKALDANRPNREDPSKMLADNNCSELTNHGDVNGGAYFCDAHSPWQKGTVENTIGRLRRDMPRKTCRQDYSVADFDDIIFMHNNTPRKCLSFKTSTEAFLTEFNHVALGL
jgi:IS30 family transposase